MTWVSLRPGRPEEAVAISALALRSKGFWGYDEDFLAACRAALTVAPSQCDGTHVVVAEDAGELVGFYRLAGDPPVAELADLFVDPTSIGRGVGRRLIDNAIARARVMGIQQLTIDADPHAEAFYLHAGARRVGSVPSDAIAGRELPRLVLPIG